MSYLTAEEACRRLGVSPATLYSYVSRGLLGSEGQPGTRRCLYREEEVERLASRRRHRRHPEQAAAEALQWGSPVLESALTCIQDGQLYYRGQLATELASRTCFEQVVELLWEGQHRPGLPPPGPWQEAFKLASRLEPTEAFRLVLVAAGSTDPAARDLQPDSVRRTGSRILTLLGRCLTDSHRAGRPLARSLASAWTPGNPAAERALEATLILCADHELNTSAFTARCVASAEASPYAVVGAALAALEGGRHGGHTRRVAALFEEASHRGARPTLEDRLRRGEPIPGFGHPLYPEGDPRARHLLDKVTACALGRELLQAAESLHLRPPSLDFALVSLARSMSLPSGAPLTLFALGRTAGWLAHAMEQYRQGWMIRPRARYTGV
ncbi:MAG: citrate synthase [Candidatus Xenobia bacterium]